MSHERSAHFDKRVALRKGWACRLLLSLAGVLVAAAVARCADPTMPGQLRLLDLTGHFVRPLGSTRAHASVFLFTRTDCPVSNRYAPEIRRIHQAFASQGVDFWLVYVDPDESADTIRHHVEDYGYRCGVLLDPRHTLVKMTGAKVTPEAAVFVSGTEGWRMVYRGRIDDQYVDFGKLRPAPTSHDLEQVLRAVLEGKPVASKATPAIGCFISDLP